MESSSLYKYYRTCYYRYGKKGITVISSVEIENDIVSVQDCYWYCINIENLCVSYCTCTINCVSQSMVEILSIMSNFQILLSVANHFGT